MRIEGSGAVLHLDSQMRVRITKALKGSMRIMRSIADRKEDCRDRCCALRGCRQPPHQRTRQAGRAFMRIVLVVVIASVVAAALPAFAQAGSDNGKEVRIVGCVQWEKEYRRLRHEGPGGALGSGIGVGNEFVLAMVKPDATRKATAYSITGDREKELGRRIGQRIEVIGVVEDEGKADADRFGDLPRIRMKAWVPIKDSCAQ